MDILIAARRVINFFEDVDSLVKYRIINQTSNFFEDFVSFHIAKFFAEHLISILYREYAKHVKKKKNTRMYTSSRDELAKVIVKTSNHLQNANTKLFKTILKSTNAIFFFYFNVPFVLLFVPTATGKHDFFLTR